MHLKNNTLKVTIAFLSLLCISDVHAEQMNLRVISGQPAEIYTAVSKKFMEANPDISVAIETVANDEEMTQALLRGKIVGDIPDVAFPGFQALGVFSENGLNTNLDDFIARDASFKSLAIKPQMIDLASYGSHVVGLPFGVSSPVFYFNADLVQKAGFDPNNIPEDWDSILKISKAITMLEGHPSGMYFDYYNVSGGQSFAVLVLGEGGQLLTPDREGVAFDGPAGQKAFELLKEIGEAGHVEMQSSQAAQAFASGSLGILMRSSVNTRRILEQVGSKFPVVAKSIPIASADGKLPVGGKAVVMLATDRSKQDAAWKFLKFVVSQEGQMQMANASGYTPINDSAIASLQAALYKEQPAYQITPSVLPRIAKWDSFPGANAVKAVDALCDHMQQVITLKAKPDEALSDLANDVRGMIKQ